MVCFTTVDHSSVVLQTMFATKKHMDVSFLAGPEKKIVQAHRSVLSAALEYFDLMLSGSFKEGESSTIILDQIEEEILESIIKFLYCGVIEIPDMETAFQLWEPCHMMKIKSLQEHNVEFMKNNITSQNCWGVYLLAKKYEEEELASLSMAFAVSNIEKVIDEDEFLHLAKDHLIEFIKAAKEKDALEDIIGKAALTWLNFNEQRQEHFKEILFLLDIEKIDDPSLIADLESMCTDIDLIKYISKACRKRLFNNKSLVHPLNRSPVDGIVVIQNNGTISEFGETSNQTLSQVNADLNGSQVHPINLSPVDIVFLIQNNGRNSTISEFDVTSNLILGEENADLDGIVLETWNGTLIILDIPFKITRYNIKTKISSFVGAYNIGNYLDATILDNGLYICTANKCYIIDLMSGRLLKTLNCPPTYRFKGVTSCEKTVYFTVLKYNQQYKRCELRVAQYLRDTNLIEIVSTPKLVEFTYMYIYIKCIGHNNSIFILSENGISVFEPIKKEWKQDQTINLSSMFDAVSTKNKLIVLQDNALYEINSNYQLIKLQHSLKEHLKMFTL